MMMMMSTSRMLPNHQYPPPWILHCQQYHCRCRDDDSIPTCRRSSSLGSQKEETIKSRSVVKNIIETLDGDPKTPAASSSFE